MFLIRLIFLWSLLIAQVWSENVLAGGKVEWARLKTDSPSWDRHAKADHVLIDYIRSSTTLNIDPQWRAADVENLKQMSAYPFLFCEGLGYVDAKGRDNVREYIKRGGFLFIDSCISPTVNPVQTDFIAVQMKALGEIVDNLHTEPIPSSHEIYHNCFDMVNGLPHTRADDPVRWPIVGLTAIYSRDRLVGIISTSGLQCGWAGIGDSEILSNECMRMMINIYVYAITH